MNGYLKNDYDDMWLDNTKSAILSLLEGAEWDTENKQVILVAGGGKSQTCKSYYALLGVLSEVAMDAFYEYVPCEDGEAMYDFDDSIVEETLLSEFEEQVESMGWI